MTHEKFDLLLAERIVKITNSLKAKAEEYAKEDRLHNFKRASEMLRCSPARALVGMFTKHMVSILDIVDSGLLNSAQIDEKIGDAINYLILLEAILIEEGNMILHIDDVKQINKGERTCKKQKNSKSI